MKKNVFVGLFLILGCSFLFAQTRTDTTKSDEVYPQFYDSFSAEESWEIHREAYIKQLKSKNLSDKAIKKELKIYDDKKADFIKRVIKLRKEAAEKRLMVEKQREKAEALRAKAEEQRAVADELRKDAERQRKRAEIIRSRMEKRVEQASLQREEAVKQREFASIQRQKAVKLRQAAMVQRKEAMLMRRDAEVIRRKAEKLRNSVEVLFSDNVEIKASQTSIERIPLQIKGDSGISISIFGSIKSGIAKMELFDPNGKKEGELTLEHKSDKNLKENTVVINTSGSFTKTIDNPKNGTWIIKITPNSAKATINYRITRFKPMSSDE